LVVGRLLISACFRRRHGRLSAPRPTAGKWSCGGCLTMAAPAGVIRAPARNRLDNQRECTLETKAGPPPMGTPPDHSSELTPRPGRIAPSPCHACAARASSFGGWTPAGRAPKACRAGGAMRTARSVSSKNGSQAVRSAFAGIRHGRSGSPGG
jgi:hypothetical protein